MNGLEVSNLKLRCDLDQVKEQLALVEEETSHHSYSLSSLLCLMSPGMPVCCQLRITTPRGNVESAGGPALRLSEPTQSVALSHVSHVISSQARPFVPAVESATTSQLRAGALSTQVMPPPSSTLIPAPTMAPGTARPGGTTRMVTTTRVHAAGVRSRPVTSTRDTTATVTRSVSNSSARVVASTTTSSMITSPTVASTGSTGIVSWLCHFQGWDFGRS